MPFINGCGGYKGEFQSRNIPLITSQQTINPNDGYDGIDNLTIDPTSILQSKTIGEGGTIAPDSDYVAFSDVTVSVCTPFYTESGSDTTENPNATTSYNLTISIPNNTKLRASPPKYVFIFNTTPDQTWSRWDGLQFLKMYRYTENDLIKYKIHLYTKVLLTNRNRVSIDSVIHNTYNNQELWPLQSLPPNTTRTIINVNDDGSWTFDFRISDFAIVEDDINTSSSGPDGQLVPRCSSDDGDVQWLHTGTYKAFLIWDLEDIPGMNDEWISSHSFLI